MNINGDLTYEEIDASDDGSEPLAAGAEAAGADENPTDVIRVTPNAYTLNKEEPFSLPYNTLRQDALKEIAKNLATYLALTPFMYYMGKASGDCGEHAVVPENMEQMLAIPADWTQPILPFLKKLAFYGSFTPNFTLYFSSLIATWEGRGLFKHYLNPQQVGYFKAFRNIAICGFGGLSALTSATAMIQGGDRRGLSSYTAFLNMPPLWIFFLIEIASRSHSDNTKRDIALYTQVASKLNRDHHAQIVLFLKALKEMAPNENANITELISMISSYLANNKQTSFLTLRLEQEITKMLARLTSDEIAELCLKLTLVCLSQDEHYDMLVTIAGQMNIKLENTDVYTFSERANVIQDIENALTSDSQKATDFDAQLILQLDTKTTPAPQQLAEQILATAFSVFGTLGGLYAWYGVAAVFLHFAGSNPWVSAMIYALTSPLLICNLVMYKQAGDALFKILKHLSENTVELMNKQPFLKFAVLALAQAALACFAVSGLCVTNSSEKSYLKFANGQWNEVMTKLFGELGNDIIRVGLNWTTFLTTSSVNVWLLSFPYVVRELEKNYNLLLLACGTHRGVSNDAPYTLSSAFKEMAAYLQQNPEPANVGKAENKTVRTDSTESATSMATVSDSGSDSDGANDRNDFIAQVEADQGDFTMPLLVKSSTDKQPMSWSERFWQTTEQIKGKFSYFNKDTATLPMMEEECEPLTP